MKKAEQSLHSKKEMIENTRAVTKKQASVRRLWSALVPAAIICVLVLGGCKNGVGEEPPGAALDEAGHPAAEGSAGTEGSLGPEHSEASEGSQNPEDREGMADGPAASLEASSDYILPGSDRELVEWADVKGLTTEQVRLARNEIYARHGRGFKSQDLQAYFDARPWYEKTVEPDDFSESLLNDYEKRNIRYLKGLEPVDGLPGLSDAPSKPVVDQYGYEGGHSLLSFELKPGTVKDCGEYYQVDAVFAQAIEAPGDLSYGDRITLVFNELTGETKTLEYREEGLYPLNEGPYPSVYYYRKHEDGSPVVLYQDSDDRVDKPFFEGQLYIRKDATKEIDIERMSAPVTYEDLNGEFNWYNGVFFDRKGYAVRLVFYGD